MHYINTNIKNRNKTENGMYSKMETLKDDDSNKTVTRPIPMIRCVFIPGGKVFQICGPWILKEDRPNVLLHLVTYNLIKCSPCGCSFTC